MKLRRYSSDDASTTVSNAVHFVWMVQKWSISGLLHVFPPTHRESAWGQNVLFLIVETRCVFLDLLDVVPWNFARVYEVPLCCLSYLADPVYIVDPSLFQLVVGVSHALGANNVGYQVFVGLKLLLSLCHKVILRVGLPPDNVFRPQVFFDSLVLVLPRASVFFKRLVVLGKVLLRVI